MNWFWVFLRAHICLVSPPKVSIGYVKVTYISIRQVKVTKDGTVKEMHEDMENENASLELKFKEDIHQQNFELCFQDEFECYCNTHPSDGC